MTPKYVTISQTVEIERNTVEGLLETLKAVFAGKVKPIQVVYKKNEPLVVDKRVRQEVASSGGLLTAYQMVRQHADIEIVESTSAPLRVTAEAAQSIASLGFSLTALVCNNRFGLYSWFDKTLRPDKIFGVPLIEDPECQSDCFFLCGSKSGPTVKDIEYAILCRM